MGGVVASVPGQLTLPALQTWENDNQREISSVRIVLLVMLPVIEDNIRKKPSLILSIFLTACDFLQLTLLEVVGGDVTSWSSSEIKL